MESTQTASVTPKVSLRSELEEIGNSIKKIEEKDYTYLDCSKYVVARLDGKCFHTFTRKFEKPMDAQIVEAMHEGALAVMKSFRGSFAYFQSDECTLVISPKLGKDNNMIPLPYKGRRDKLVSLLASTFSVTFSMKIGRPAHFDCRIFNVDDLQTVLNVIRWRQLDAFRNGISAIAQHMFSPKQLLNKGVGDMKLMIGEELEKYKSTHLIHGTFIYTEEYTETDSTIRHRLVSFVFGTEDRIVNLEKELQERQIKI